MELWDVYDKNRVKTGKVLERGSPFSVDDYHLVVHICIFNPKGEMLIQQRQSFKSDWPDKWDITVGGCAIAGEDNAAAAHREVLEELGLDIDFTKLRPGFSINFDNGFDDYYLIEADADIDKLSLQYEEVQAVKWASREEILAMIDSGEFIQYYKHLANLFFDMRKRLGSHTD